MDHHLTLLTIIEKAKPELDKLSENQLIKKLNPIKWSKLEIIGHLVDSAYHNHLRIINAPLKDNLIFEGYDQDHCVAQNNYQNRNHKEVLSLFYTAQTHLFYAMASLDEKLLNRTTSQHNFDTMAMRKVATGTMCSLNYLVEDYIFHLEHHLAQIIPQYNFVAR